MNRHQFQLAARQFRAGKISLEEFTNQVYSHSSDQSQASEPTQWPLPELPAREPESHKTDYGRVMVVAGSQGMAGAAALTGMAALRSGAGLVWVATPRSCQDLVAGFHPALMTIGLPEDKQGRVSVLAWRELVELVGQPDCLAIGPGLGQSPQLKLLVRDIWAHCPVPVVLDADALNNLAKDFSWPVANQPRVLTPHPGEFQRLTGSRQTNRQHLENEATKFAGLVSAVLVFKGHRSLVTDGQRNRHNQTGNPGMATAGSGDVLTGMIAAMLGQGLNPWDAAVLGCHLHGAAGDRAKSRLGEISLTAVDIIDEISEVTK